MTDAQNNPPPVAPGHRVPDEEWAGVVADAALYAAESGWTDPEEPPGLLRRLVASVTPRKMAPIVDWTGRGAASGKYFPVSGIPTQLLVLHSAECPLAAGYAQSLTNWALQPGYPQASWHRFVDPGARVRMIDDSLGAWHASEANPLSIGWEQAGYARFTRAEWTTAAGMLQLEALALDMAEVAKRDGIPARWLSNAEVRAVLDGGNRSIKGFCTHRQIDPETRTDPGDGYPFDLLMAAIKRHLAVLNGTTKPPTEDGNMPTIADVLKAIAGMPTAIWHTRIQQYKTDGKTPLSVQPAHFILGNLSQMVTRILDGNAANKKAIDGVNGKVDAVSKSVAELNKTVADLRTALQADNKPPAPPA